MKSDNEIPGKVSRRRSILRAAVLIVATVVVIGIPMSIIGFAAGYMAARNQRGDSDIAMVNDIVTENPERYSSLEINRGPLDKFVLQGTVSNQQIADELRQELISSFGEMRTERVFAVEVDDSPVAKTDNSSRN